jgi:hypothetical protein
MTFGQARMRRFVYFLCGTLSYILGATLLIGTILKTL